MPQFFPQAFPLAHHHHRETSPSNNKMGALWNSMELDSRCPLEMDYNGTLFSQIYPLTLCEVAQILWIELKY